MKDPIGEWLNSFFAPKKEVTSESNPVSASETPSGTTPKESSGSAVSSVEKEIQRVAVDINHIFHPPKRSKRHSGKPKPAASDPGTESSGDSESEETEEGES